MFYFRVHDGHYCREQLLKTALNIINLKTRYLDEEQERHGLNQNPVYISVHDFEASRACKERSDGIAIATLASIASKVIR